MIRPILIWPDPTLATKSVPVTVFDQHLQALVDDMLDTMRDEDGCGLAAVQIGVLKRVVVVELPEGKTEPFRQIILINPVITARSGSRRSEEGCLSVPGESAEVTRAAKITVTAQTVTGESQDLHLDGFTATAIQHEIDHLDGILYVDHLSQLKRSLIRKQVLKYKARMAKKRPVPA